MRLVDCCKQKYIIEIEILTVYLSITDYHTSIHRLLSELLLHLKIEADMNVRLQWIVVV